MRQRLFSALVAILSFFALNAAHVTSAQERPASSEPSATQERTETGEALVLKAGERVESLVVRDRPLVIEGEVTHDVVAFNSEVQVKPGATVGGHILVFNGSVTNEAGEGIRLIVNDGTDLKTSGELRVSSSDAHSGGIVTHVESRPGPAAITRMPHPAGAAKQNDWAGNQFLLLLFGLIGGFILLLVAPKATEQATDALSLEPGRCLLVGAVGAFGLLVVALVNAMAIKSPVGLLWSPVGTLLGILTLIVIAFGWLCGMRLMGDLVAKKFRRYDEGHLLGRIALGLIAFCFAKILLYAVGGYWLGGAGQVLEVVVAMMGLGAAMISGFGSNPDWLGARLRGERRWLSRR